MRVDFRLLAVREQTELGVALLLLLLSILVPIFPCRCLIPRKHSHALSLRLEPSDG